MNNQLARPRVHTYRSCAASPVATGEVLREEGMATGESPNVGGAEGTEAAERALGRVSDGDEAETLNDERRRIATVVARRNSNISQRLKRSSFVVLVSPLAEIDTFKFRLAFSTLRHREQRESRRLRVPRGENWATVRLPSVCRPSAVHMAHSTMLCRERETLSRVCSRGLYSE